MDVTALLDTTSGDIEIIFYKYPGNINIPNGEYPLINKLNIFGLFKRPIRAYYTDKIVGIQDINPDHLIYDDKSGALFIKDLGLPMNNDHIYKVILKIHHE